MNYWNLYKTCFVVGLSKRLIFYSRSKSKVRINSSFNSSFGFFCFLSYQASINMNLSITS